MKQKEYLEFHKRICDEARALSKRKNADYADPESYQDDPFAVFRNFLQCESLGICSVESGFLVRLSDKFSRLCNLLHEGHESEVPDESIQDTCQDVINYVILLLGFLETKKSQPVPAPEEDDLRHTWFRSVQRKHNPGMSLRDIQNGYEKWVHLSNEKGFVCPICLSVRWGTSSWPGEPDTGVCHACGFRWDRKTEDQYFGKTEEDQPTVPAEAKIHFTPEIIQECADIARINWFEQVWERHDPNISTVAIGEKYEEWRRLCSEREGFVCPICHSVRWGSIILYGARDTGVCYETYGSICGFRWNRDTEDKFLGLEMRV